MPMSAEQKLANRAANKVRDAAYARRYQQYRREMDDVEHNPDVRQARARVEEANARLDQELDHLQAEETRIRAQIEALEKKLAGLRKNSTVLNTLAEERRVSSNAWQAVKKRVEDSVDARYPDLQDGARWSVTGWVIPADVQAAMDAARKDPQSVLAKPPRKTRAKKAA